MEIVSPEGVSVHLKSHANTYAQIKLPTNPNNKCFFDRFCLDIVISSICKDVICVNLCSHMNLCQNVTIFDLISAHFPISAQYDNV